MEKCAIIELHKNGLSNRKIAKEIHISRTTVNKYISIYENDMKRLGQTKDVAEILCLQRKMMSKQPMNTTRRKATKFNGDLLFRFNELVRIEEEKNKKLGLNKQHINGAIIYRKLKSEGYNISESSVRAKWSEYRHSHAEVFIRQTYKYGDRAEFDFHEIKVLINNKLTKFHQATISCPASNYVFARLYKDQTIKSVEKALIEFFRYSNGVFNEVTFDNLKPVVKKYGNKESKELTDAIIKFSTYYGFKVNTCNARRGNEKGHVENSGKNARNDIFSLKYEFNSFEELNLHLINSLKEINKDSILKFEEEKKCLKALPELDFVIGDFGVANANTYSLIQIKTNYYSVPEEYVGKEVQYTLINDLLVVYYKQREIARHRVLDELNSYRIDINHYLNTLYKKPGAISRSVALEQAQKEIKFIYENKYINKPKEFIEYLFELKNKNKLCSKNNNDIEKESLIQLSLIDQTFNL